MSSLITLSICLSDIPKDKIKQSDNGKHYVNLVCAKRKEEGKYGETHTIFVSQTKEEREFQLEKQYCGSGKEFAIQAIPTPESIDSMPPADADDLPF